MNYLDLTVATLQKRKNVFLTGGAGVGKTTITGEIIRLYEAESKKVAKLASTGMAATLIGGQTLHSFFDFGIASDINELQRSGKYEVKKKIKKLIHSIDLLVVDEISMVSASLMEMIRLRLDQTHFEGVILVVGDFLQLPPVVRGNFEVMFAFESESWKHFNFETIELTHIYRTDDQKFIELLHHIRFGYIDETIHNELNSYIKPLAEDLSEFTFLFGKNNSADLHNKEQLKHIDEESFIKEMQLVKHQSSVSEKEVERFIADARIEKELELKIGAPVLFTRNAWNYFNGERGRIVNKDASYVYIQKKDGVIVKLESVAQSKNIWIEKDVDGNKEMVEENLFTVYQYPIKLAFAITIHKSQGMSIEDLIIDTNEIFAPSQFYVALSRSSNPSRLNLIAPKTQWYNLAFVNSKAIDFVQGLRC